MKNEHSEILELISIYLEKNPSQRFGQAIFNMRINEFVDKQNPEQGDYSLRDIYNDSDLEIIKRIKKQLEQINKK